MRKIGQERILQCPCSWYSVDQQTLPKGLLLDFEVAEKHPSAALSKNLLRCDVLTRTPRFEELSPPCI